MRGTREKVLANRVASIEKSIGLKYSFVIFAEKSHIEHLQSHASEPTCLSVAHLEVEVVALVAAEEEEAFLQEEVCAHIFPRSFGQTKIIL